MGPSFAFKVQLNNCPSTICSPPRHSRLPPCDAPRLSYDAPAQWTPRSGGGRLHSQNGYEQLEKGLNCEVNTTSISWTHIGTTCDEQITTPEQENEIHARITRDRLLDRMCHILLIIRCRSKQNLDNCPEAGDQQ